MTGRVPVTILGGFLGSGKTTLLRGGLGAPADPATAVIVNEFGAVGLDDRFVRTVAAEPVLVAGGCACCGRREDLVAALRALLDDHERGRRALARVVIECSGLADPAPIAFTLATDPMLRHHFAVRRTVVAVDAVNGDAQLDAQPESLRQALVADELIVTKGELAGPDAVSALASRLRALNPEATLRTAVDGRLDPEPLASGGAGRAGHGGPSPAGHTADVATLTVTRARPLDWMAFSVWLSMLLHARGEDVLRVKGVVGIGSDEAVAVNGVGHVVHRPEHLPAAAAGTAPGETRLVVIARGADPAQIERSLDVFQSL